MLVATNVLPELPLGLKTQSQLGALHVPGPWLGRCWDWLVLAWVGLVGGYAWCVFALVLQFVYLAVWLWFFGSVHVCVLSCLSACVLGSEAPVLVF